ncbi:MAG: cellobiose phosphorylase [Clostridiales bacterium]|nr:cellobiose phosphorylase [Clostridiales bacterium]
MNGYEYQGGNGRFILQDADKYSYLYFPVASESGMMGSLTPELGGDLKTSQNTFLLQPVSSEDLHNNRATRNFWLCFGDGRLISATGNSVWQKALPEEMKDKVILEGNALSQKITRTMKDPKITCESTTFVPVSTEDAVELTRIVIRNDGDSDITFTPTFAVPVYGRSADNIRDHRNVTSMLNRISVTEFGIVNDPTLTFDERGHQRNTCVYGGFAAASDDGSAPGGFCPTTEEFIGEGGSFDCPSFPGSGEPSYIQGDRIDGFEVMASGRFGERTLAPGTTCGYILALVFLDTGNAADTEEDLASHASMIEKTALKYLEPGAFEKEYEKMIRYWDLKNNIRFHTGDPAFDNWMYWVGIQPMLRRIYGCSFLPHHDYGKGGRGWRDLWQDCLALIMMDPSDVREMLKGNFGGVRTDGSNATIIGSRQGEFIADRNGITRVWMDHAMWPFMTMELYIRQSGDIGILDEEVPYFSDRQVMRGQMLLESDTGIGSSSGSILEHLLVQNLTAFYDTGEHGHMKLRGADWNDALDMAKDRGESVAFTAAYCGNFRRFASILKKYAEMTGRNTISAASEIGLLIGTGDPASFGDILGRYCDKVKNGFSGEKTEYDIETLAKDLLDKASYIEKHIRETEWYTDPEGYSRYNGYYDNSGRPLEKNGGMMLTGQVFTVMSGVATDDQVKEIIRSADRYLYDADLGGYKLNTDFREIKTDMGRMFGFAYGQKENGAVFCHMAVMYGNALYGRGFAEAGWKVIGSLYDHAGDFKSSKIYPGIPEYFDPRGRGVYHYLTGAASWLMLTVLTEMFGIKGEYGDLKFEPKLLPGHFDTEGTASVSMVFDGKPVTVVYKGPGSKVIKIIAGDTVIEGNIIPRDKITGLIEVELA